MSQTNFESKSKGKISSKRVTQEQDLDNRIARINSYLKAQGSKYGYIIDRSYGRQNLYLIDFENYKTNGGTVRIIRSLTKPEMYDVLLGMESMIIDCLRSIE